MSSVQLSSASSKKFHLKKLTDAAHFPRWKAALQDHFFSRIKNNNMDLLNTMDTLDDKYFKKEFAAEYKAAAAPFQDKNPWQDEHFATLCKAHAFKTAEGFEDWVYHMYSDIRTSLSDEIQDQTAGVVRGDIVGLLVGIKLAVQYFEAYNPDELEIQYTRCTMAEGGGSDVMKYTALLQSFLNRLKTANAPIKDSKAQRVLLNGIHPTIFENFINDAERTPYPTYDQLVTAFLKLCSKERIMMKLRALKPGRSHTMTTRSTDCVPKRQRTSSHDDGYRSERLD